MSEPGPPKVGSPGFKYGFNHYNVHNVGGSGPRAPGPLGSVAGERAVFCFKNSIVLYLPTPIYFISYSAARQASSGLFAQRPARAAATNRLMRLSSHAGALCSRLILSRLQFP